MDPANSKTVFCIVGGFLGAGKTTAVLQLARRLQSTGRRVGVITNDQAPGLVDTAVFRSNGFRAEEVAGACFCCHFEELARCADVLQKEHGPDWIFAEPVGSCTDIAATVVRPLRKMFNLQYELTPFSVLVDPVRARQFLLERNFGGFSSKVAYIYFKQLEEADIICLNKTDAIDAESKTSLAGALARECPRARVISISAKTGEGFESWIQLLQDRAQTPGTNVMDVDYDIYAEGEAALGWVNVTFEIASPSPFAADDFIVNILEFARDRLAETGGESAHIKALAETSEGAAAAAFTGASSKIQISQKPRATVRSAALTVNARVHMSPDTLKQIVLAAVERAAARSQAAARVVESYHFKPARPVPTFRYHNES
ncbi:MAG: cobalamin biosynthesis protein P47K [Planctomycetes bacterium]|nr:cobalamin biosynthesis protein P47K [Planctomycetota bacterium]